VRDIPFIDAHVHLWDPAHLRYPWLTPPFSDDGPNGSVAAIAAPYHPADYRLETASWSVAGYVHVEAGADPCDAVAETEWLADLADGPAGMVAFAALDAADVDATLARHAAEPRVRGIRHILNWHADPRRTYTPRDLSVDDAFARGFARLRRHGYSFDCQAYPGQFAALARLFGRHPDIPVIIDHLGMPIMGDPDGRASWRHGLQLLAALPHVFIKISGLGFVRRPWSANDARPLVLEAIDLFGPDRVCVASDFPTDRLFGSLDATLGAYAEIIADFSELERRAMWGGNADRFYGLGLLQEPSHG
jgi:predicted TIM-barrel fold metal-dependent hydrolase